MALSRLRHRHQRRRPGGAADPAIARMYAGKEATAEFGDYHSAEAVAHMAHFLRRPRRGSNQRGGIRHSYCISGAPPRATPTTPAARCSLNRAEQLAVLEQQPALAPLSGGGPFQSPGVRSSGRQELALPSVGPTRKASSTATPKAVTRRFVSAAMPTMAINSAYSWSVMPFARALEV